MSLAVTDSSSIRQALVPGWTLVTALCGFAIALLLGTWVGVMRTTPLARLRAPGTAFVEVFRNIPLLVQMFLWYFVLPERLLESLGTWLEQLPNAQFYTAARAKGQQHAHSPLAARHS